MTIALLLILGLCVLGVLHTYVIYPQTVISKARARKVPSQLSAGRNVAGSPAVEKSVMEWPKVSVLMAVHNEEAVLQQKMESLMAQDYPGPIRFLIGSDNSDDRTNEILVTLQKTEPRLYPTYFRFRHGKPGIINQLAHEAGPDGYYIITDASVMLRPDTITELIRPMVNDPTIAVVDSTMVQVGGTAAGIGKAETAYIDREVRVKRAEGQLYGAMVGPFGGCYALLADTFRPIPDRFLVDDFYLCMCAYERNYRGVSSASALVEEAVGQHLQDEFRRKVRISSGNWQNLARFRSLWWFPSKSNLAWAFFSHKVLRWWTPFLLIIGALAWLGLYFTTGNHWVGISLIVLSGVLLLGALADVLLSDFNINIGVLRKLRYFLAMNAALLVGFYRYITGIRSNVWQPSNRH